MNDRLARAQVLIEHGRLDQAEQELHRTLAAEPDDPFVHALISVCQREQKKLDEALQSAQRAVGCGPDVSFAHEALADAYLAKRRYEPAMAAIREAIRLQPGDPDCWATLSAIHFGRREWKEALQAAERGLTFDAEDLSCVNLRAMALVALGRKDEADQTVGFALKKGAENAVSHANAGWTALHRGEHHKAMERFREALRLQPDLDWARQGLLEAIKARNPVYRILLSYFLWTTRLGRAGAWATVILSYVGFRALRSAALNFPQARPVLIPLVALAALAILLTWIGSPFFNLLLRFSRFGRYVLSDRERAATNWLAGLLLLAAGIAVAYGVFRKDVLFVALVLSLVATIPATRTCQIADERHRRRLLAALVILAVAGAAGTVAASLGLNGLGALLVMPLAFYAIAFQWVANWRAIRR